MEICVKYNKRGGGWGCNIRGAEKGKYGHYKTIEQLLQETLVWVFLGRVFSIIIIMSFPLQGIDFFIMFFLVFFNQLSKFLFFCQTILFFTSNECFSYFNVQQLLSNISHFVLFSQAHLKITLKTKTFEKIYFIRFYWMSNTRVCFTPFKVFWSKTWKSKS